MYARWVLVWTFKYSVKTFIGGSWVN